GLETVFEHLLCRAVIALLARQNCTSKQKARAKLRTSRGTFQRQDPGDAVTALRKMFPCFPEAKQGGADAKAPVGIPSFDQIIERQAEVVVLDLKTVEPFGVSGHVLGTFFGKHKVISGMGSASRRFIVALREAFESVLPDGGEHKEARFLIDLLHLLRQALVHQRSHAVEYVQAQIGLDVAHGFHAFQRAATCKHGKPPKERLFSAVEEAVTPVHGVAKGLLPRWQIAGAA